MDKSKWDPSKEIPSLAGKVIVVTGGNSGIGKQTVLDLAQHKPQLIWLASRDVENGNDAIADIKKVVPDANIRLVDLDLASVDSIKTAAFTILASSDRLDILVCNAGIWAVPPGLTADGYEIQFGVNHVGHAFLIRLLTPLLLRTAETASNPAPDVRVVLVSSKAVINPGVEGGIQLDKVRTRCEHLGKEARYGQSKLAITLYARELARHYPQIKFVAVHPGAVMTNLFKALVPAFAPAAMLMRALCKLLLWSAEDGAKNQLWAATAEGVVSGEMYYPVGVVRKMGKWQSDEKLAKRVWEWTEGEITTRL